MIKAQEALGVNIIDDVCPKGEDLDEFAVKFAEGKTSASADELAGRNLAKRTVEGNVEEMNALCDAALERLPAPAMGGEAAHGCVEAIKVSWGGVGRGGAGKANHKSGARTTKANHKTRGRTTLGDQH